MQLKGKKIGVEVGFVGHLLLLNALEKGGLKESDVKIVNMPTDQTAQALGGGKVDAIVAWQPNSGQALKELPGSKAIFTSADVPGIIYDLLCVNPKSLNERKKDWKKVVKVWYKIADFIADKKNEKEVLKIMSARVGLTPEQYAPLMKGTYFLGKEGNKKHFMEKGNLTSVYGSSKVVDEFNVKYGVYKKGLDYKAYLNPSLIE